MAKKRFTTKTRNIIAAMFLFVGIALVLNLTSSFIQYHEDLRDYEQIVLRRDALLEERTELENEIEMLNDEDYVTRYARENYVFTRDGEQVIVLPELIEE